MTNETAEQMTCRCPRGHKLRGKAEMVGKTVRCPRCSEKFVFGYFVRDSVTDTAVVRLLGDAPAPPPEPVKDPSVRMCVRCGVSTSAHLSVCQHCNCYVGVMPDFLSSITPNGKANTN